MDVLGDLGLETDNQPHWNFVVIQYKENNETFDSAMCAMCAIRK